MKKPQARFLMKQNAPQARLIKENAPQARLLTKSSWILCPVNAVHKIFPTNHNLESASFD
jgi:hypothetical protein